MKKYTLIFALIAMVVISACGNGSTTKTELVDSTEVTLDSAEIGSIEIDSSEMLIDTTVN